VLYSIEYCEKLGKCRRMKEEESNGYDNLGRRGVINLASTFGSVFEDREWIL